MLCDNKTTMYMCVCLWFQVKCLDHYWIDCHEIWCKHSCPLQVSSVFNCQNQDAFVAVAPWRRVLNILVIHNRCSPNETILSAYLDLVQLCSLSTLKST